MEFVATIPELPALTAKLKEAPAIAAPILARAFTAGQLVLAKNTGKENGPWRTGFLMTAANWKWNLSGYTGSWSPGAFYAPYVELGTKPHVILPKNKQALFWPGANHPVKSVNHPGTAPNPFMERIIAASQPEITDNFLLALEQITAAIAAT